MTQAVKAALSISVSFLVNPLISLLMLNGYSVVLIFNTSRSVDRFFPSIYVATQWFLILRFWSSGSGFFAS